MAPCSAVAGALAGRPKSLGVDGLKLKMPLKSLLTRGWLPALHPSRTIPSEDRAPLAVLTDS